MGLRINTNVQSLKAQNSLNATTKKVNNSLTKLSTGLRINSGKDDVVGLAKSESLGSRIRGIDIALSNIANAGSTLGVGEGILNQLTDISQRLRETAVQAADASISSEDRTNLTTQFTDLIAEYNRLADNANFNGTKLLDGTFSNVDLQVGPMEGDTISISISDARSATIGKVAIYTVAAYSDSGSTNTTLSATFTDPGATIKIGNVTVNAADYTSDGVSNVGASDSAIAYVNAINSKSGQTGVTATILSTTATLDYGYSIGLSSAQHLLINGVTVKSTTLSVSDSDDTDASTLVDLINDESSATGVSATIDTTNNKIVLTATDGRNINVQVSAKTTASTSSYNSFNATGGTTNSQATYRGSFTLKSDSAFDITDTSTLMGGTRAVALDASTTLENASLSTVANAADAISSLDDVIRQLQKRRATVGSTATRLDIAESELRSRQENLSAARSSIAETDIAAETAKLTQFQILQQAGVTVLAQANASPNIALTLLGNI